MSLCRYWVLSAMLLGCSSGPVKRIRFEDLIDQTHKSAGCFVWLPGKAGEGGELSLMSFETCRLIVPSEKSGLE